MKQKIALLGFGTVGQGICEILLNKKEYLIMKAVQQDKITQVNSG